MAAVSKTYGVGDTVYVHYKNSSSLQFTPTSRVVKRVKTDTSGNSAVVEFTDGDNVTDVSTDVRVYTTQTLCATGIVTWVIAQSAAAVALDSTTSIVSTAGNASTTLGLIG